MKILKKSELLAAEKALLEHLPTCLKVYGYIYAMNRNKPSLVEVVVDSWPDFKVIACRPDPENEHSAKMMKKVSYYSTDEQALRKMLTEDHVVDWSKYFVIGGFDTRHTPMLKEVASQRKVNIRTFTLVHLMYLSDSRHLLPEHQVPSQVASLDLSHVDLVNRTWKFGGDEKGHYNITNLITNYPSCCITDERGQPVSWVLLYDYCAMGLLYTVPEHRGKGHAKALISAMTRRLSAEGFPVYCFIEEGNVPSYNLLSKLGFVEDPTYRAAWFEFNF